MPKTSSMHDVAEKLATLVKFSEGGTGKVRLFTIQDGRVMKMFSGGEILRDVQDVEDVYAEELPVDESHHWEERDARVVDVFHFQKEQTRYHGVPFRFVIKAVRHDLDPSLSPLRG